MQFSKKHLVSSLLFCFLFFLSSRAFAYTNLLTNPGAETGNMSSWSTDSNGGDGWKTDWNGPGHSDARVFSTSYDWDVRHQTIDLVAAGYTTGQLDSGTFDAKMSEWLSTRGDQGGRYYLHFELLAVDGTTVLASYDRGTQGSPITLSAGTAWFQESHIFTDIPSGTRYIKFQDAGKSVAFWAGNYGTNFDDASVVLANTTLYDLTYVAGAHGTLTGTVTQTLSSGSSGTAVTAVPSTGYHFVSWTDASTANPRTDTGVVADSTVTANFAIDTHTATYTAGGNGTLTGTTSQTVNYGADASTVTAVPDTGYSFINWSDASTANPRTDTAVTSDIAVTANFADITNPTITNISSSASQHAATITWNTEQAASSLVEYGLADTYGQTTTEADRSLRVVNHSVSIGSLETCKTYHFGVTSKDASNNQTTSSDKMFTTACDGGGIFMLSLPPASVVSPQSIPATLQKIEQKQNTEIVPTPNTLAAPFKFTTDLKQGQRNEDIKHLQQFLIDQKQHIYPEAVVSGYFDKATKDAVVRFQEKHGAEILAPIQRKKGTGFVGVYTRAKVNSML